MTRDESASASGPLQVRLKWHTTREAVCKALAGGEADKAFSMLRHYCNQSHEKEAWIIAQFRSRQDQKLLTAARMRAGILRGAAPASLSDLLWVFDQIVAQAANRSIQLPMGAITPRKQLSSVIRLEAALRKLARFAVDPEIIASTAEILESPAFKAAAATYAASAPDSR